MADTAVTVQTLLDDCIVRQKDSQKVDWPDAELLRYVNKARDYIHKLLVQGAEEIAINAGTISMVSGQQEYLLSGNLDNFWAMAPNGVYFSGQTTPLFPITVEDSVRYGSTTTTEMPSYYYITSTKLGVVPIPTDTSIDSYPTLNCRYFKMESALTLASNMPYKNIFNEPVSMFASNMAMLRLGVNTAEYTTIYNALEESVRAILKRRSSL